MRESRNSDRFLVNTQVQSHALLCRGFGTSVPFITSVMIYHRGASLSEQHNDLLCTKQDLSHTSRYVDQSSPDSQVSHMYANS